MSISMIRGYVAPPSDGGVPYNGMSGAGSFSEYGYMYITQEGEGSSVPDAAAFAPTQNWNGYGASYVYGSELDQLVNALLALGLLPSLNVDTSYVIAVFTQWANAHGFTEKKYGQQWDDRALEALIYAARTRSAGRAQLGPPVARASTVRTRYAQFGSHPRVEYLRMPGLDVPGPLGAAGCGCQSCSCEPGGPAAYGEMTEGAKTVIGGVVLFGLVSMLLKKSKSRKNRRRR